MLFRSKAREKAPDVIAWDARRGWLFLMEAASTHGPVDVTRKAELHDLFRSEEHTSELQSRDSISYAVFYTKSTVWKCLNLHEINGMGSGGVSEGASGNEKPMGIVPANRVMRSRRTGRRTAIR